MEHENDGPRGEGSDPLRAELARLRAIEVAARALSDALSRDEGYDHFCNEETERAAVALGRLLP